MLNRYAVRVGRHEEQSNIILRVVAGSDFRTGGDDDGIGGVGIRDEQLDAVDGVAAAGRAGRGLNAPSLRGGRRLGEGQSQPHRPGADAGQQFPLLVVIAGVQHGEAAQHDGSKVRSRQQGPPHFLNQHCQVQERAAGAAILLRERNARPAQAADLTPQVFGES